MRRKEDLTFFYQFEALADSFFAGTHDKYNMDRSMSSEVCVRRIQAIVDAFSDPECIDFSQAKRFWGVEALD